MRAAGSSGRRATLAHHERFEPRVDAETQRPVMHKDRGLRQCSGMSPELSRDSLLRLTAEGERMIARVARFTGQPERFTSGEYRWVLTAGLLE